MVGDPPGEQLTSLVVQSTHELSARASLVMRGLRDISKPLRASSIESAQEQSMVLLQQGRIEEAIAICSSGLELSPTDEILWQIKGVCLAKRGEYGEGLNCIDRALQSNADNPYCWVLKCSLLRSLNRTEERLECWRRVIKMAPDFQGAWKAIGGCLFALGRFAAAAQAYDSELTLNPKTQNVVRRERLHSLQRNWRLIGRSRRYDWTSVRGGENRSIIAQVPA